jgi:hypothetical protein
VIGDEVVLAESTVHRLLPAVVSAGFVPSACNICRYALLST